MSTTLSTVALSCRPPSRCATPPTFVCYELPQPDPYSRSSSPTSSSGDDECEDSGTESSSNLDEDEHRSPGSSNAPVERSEMKSIPVPISGNWEVVDADMDVKVPVAIAGAKNGKTTLEPQDIPCPPSGNEEDSEDASERLRAEKREGKKKEVVVSESTDADDKMEVEVKVEHESPSKRKSKKKKSRRHRGEEQEPILTIRSSQGFVWNQDLFVPSYIKERYIASSPPSSFTPMGSSPTASKSNLVNNNFFSSSNEMDYEVECVEIRVDEDELDSIIPRA
ncbi:hypothetical protein FRB96_004873 [Tulasnella sp. 330]|nr:hypothetical protein FRB96_004873 [Tulasnella sp. 330]KAG8885436.1 hypothetical protein FRB97_001159 [Tulasnella sp. 331]